MGATPSVDVEQLECFDHKIWAEKHKSELEFMMEAKDSQSVQNVFRYVQSHHPNMGCALSPLFMEQKRLLKKMKSMPLSELAKYADAVAVICCELVGETMFQLSGGQTRQWLTDPNETSIGNVAYMACHHSKEAIRAQAQNIIQLFKAKVDE